MVADPLVVPAQQSDVDGGFDAVGPGVAEYRPEQLSMELVHLVVLVLQLLGCLDIALGNDVRGRGDHRVSHLTHRPNGGLQLLRHRVLRLAPARQLGDVRGVITHPLEIGDDPHRGHQLAEIAGDRLLGRHDQERAILDVVGELVDAGVVGDHLLGQGPIGVQQGQGGRSQ